MSQRYVVDVHILQTISVAVDADDDQAALEAACRPALEASRRPAATLLRTKEDPVPPGTILQIESSDEIEGASVHRADTRETRHYDRNGDATDPAPDAGIGRADADSPQGLLDRLASNNVWLQMLARNAHRICRMRTGRDLDASDAATFVTLYGQPGETLVAGDLAKLARLINEIGRER